MPAIALRTLVLSCVFALAGCATEDVMRYDGVTTSAGDAIAANSAMQIVDPWPYGVEETRLSTPAWRERSTTATAVPPATDY